MVVSRPSWSLARSCAVIGSASPWHTSWLTWCSRDALARGRSREGLNRFPARSGAGGDRRYELGGVQPARAAGAVHPQADYGLSMMAWSSVPMTQGSFSDQTKTALPAVLREGFADAGVRPSRRAESPELFERLVLRGASRGDDLDEQGRADGRRSSSSDSQCVLRPCGADHR